MTQTLNREPDPLDEATKAYEEAQQKLIDASEEYNALQQAWAQAIKTAKEAGGVVPEGMYDLKQRAEAAHVRHIHCRKQLIEAQEHLNRIKLEITQRRGGPSVAPPTVESAVQPSQEPVELTEAGLQYARGLIARGTISEQLRPEEQEAMDRRDAERERRRAEAEAREKNPLHDVDMERLKVYRQAVKDGFYNEGFEK